MGLDEVAGEFSGTGADCIASAAVVGWSAVEDVDWPDSSSSSGGSGDSGSLSGTGEGPLGISLSGTSTAGGLPAPGIRMGVAATLARSDDGWIFEGRATLGQPGPFSSSLGSEDGRVVTSGVRTGAFGVCTVAPS